MRPLAALPVIALLLSPGLLGSSGLTVNNSVPVNGNTCDQVLWNDAAGRPREMDIVQLAGNPGGNTGGYITRVNYNDGAATVTCNESGYSVDGTLSGLGQMVNHGGTGNGWVCSNLDGIKTGATTQVLFQGANHAIYQVDMDEYGDNGDHSKGTWHDRWIYFVANGRDAIVESLSYDFSSHVAGYWGYAGVSGQTAHDSRSPYCSFNWTGTGAANTFTESIDGLEYAVRDATTNSYIFKAIGSSPFSAGYTFNTPAANIPYTLQWKASPDREIGYVSTFDLTQFAAGGGFTSAVNVGTSGSTMPANWGINYQGNGFQNWVGDKMTWGVPYGAAGGTTGSTTFPDWTYARNWTGYPTMGYTIQIQLGKHSDDNVRKLAAEQSAIHALPAAALTAAVGAVVTSGKMNLQDAVGGFTFKPQGFNHMYNAWEVTCAGSAADVTLALGAVSLQHPTFLFDGFTNAALCQLTLNGVAQVEGSDMFSSVDATDHKLYVTFNKALTGSAHIAFPGSCGSPTASPSASLTPTQGPAYTPTASPTIGVGGSGKSYCITVNYAAAPALLNYHKVTLNVNVGNCSSVTATEDGNPIPATYNAGSGIATLTADSTLASSSIILTAVGWTSGGTGAVSKANLYNNMKWAFSQTFDDGYSSAWTYGKPVLDAHGWRAGEAFVGSFVGQNWGADPALGTETLLTTAQWQALRAAGWDVYNHTYTHPNLTCANFQAEFDQNQALALTIFGTGYHLSHIVYPFEDATPASSACAGFPPSYLISGEQNSDTYNYVDVPIPMGFRGTPMGNVYAASRSGDVLNATSSGNLAYWEAKADAAAGDARNTWLIDICHRVYPANLIGNDTSYSNNVTNLTAFYNYLDGKYGAGGGNGTMWVAPSGEVMDYLMTRDAVTLSSAACGTPTPTPTYCGACSPTYTGTATYTPTPSYTATAVPLCSGNSIDDFEHAPGVNAFGGYWYTFATAPSTIAPATFAPASPGYGGAGSCAHASGTMSSGAALGMGTGLAAAGTNASAFSGISFWFKGDGGSYRFQIHSAVEAGAYNDYKYDFVAPAGWSFINIPWSSFSFPGWGTAYSLDTTQLLQLSWVPMSVGAYDFSVDNVIFNCPVPTPTPSGTVAAGSPTATRTSTASPSPTATATASPTPSRTSTVAFSATPTPSASPSPSMTPPATATATLTPSSTLSASPTFTDVPPGSTLTNTPTISPTWSASPSPSATDVDTATVTPSASPTVSPWSSATATATPSASGTVTATASPFPAASPTASPGPSLTVSPTLVAPTATSTLTRTATPPPSPNATPSVSPANSPVSTATATPTTLVPAGSPSCTPAGSAALGPLRITGLRPYPNPNAHGVAVKLEGATDKVTLRLYSVAETRVLDVDAGPAAPGWVLLDLPVGWSSGLHNGIYYVRATAYRGEVASAPTAPARLVLIR